MKTIDESGNIIENPDLEKGYLEPAKETVHHEAVEGVEEQYHQETIAEYPNGGKDVEKVIDVEGVKAKDAWDEEVDVMKYVLYTEAELTQRCASTTVRITFPPSCLCIRFNGLMVNITASPARSKLFLQATLPCTKSLQPPGSLLN